jgi:hypothetical protein
MNTQTMIGLGLVLIGVGIAGISSTQPAASTEAASGPPAAPWKRRIEVLFDLLRSIGERAGETLHSLLDGARARRRTRPGPLISPVAAPRTPTPTPTPTLPSAGDTNEPSTAWDAPSQVDLVAAHQYEPTAPVTASAPVEATEFVSGVAPESEPAPQPPAAVDAEPTIDPEPEPAPADPAAVVEMAPNGGAATPPTVASPPNAAVRESGVLPELSGALSERVRALTTSGAHVGFVADELAALAGQIAPDLLGRDGTVRTGILASLRPRRVRFVDDRVVVVIDTPAAFRQLASVIEVSAAITVERGRLSVRDVRGVPGADAVMLANRANDFLASWHDALGERGFEICRAAVHDGVLEMESVQRRRAAA